MISNKIREIPINFHQNENENDKIQKNWQNPDIFPKFFKRKNLQILIIERFEDMFFENENSYGIFHCQRRCLYSRERVSKRGRKFRLKA